MLRNSNDKSFCSNGIATQIDMAFKMHCRASGQCSKESTTTILMCKYMYKVVNWIYDCIQQ